MSDDTDADCGSRVLGLLVVLLVGGIVWGFALYGIWTCATS